MKITVSVSKKIGQPNYGSAGASCEITIVVPEETASDNPTSVVAEVRRAYALAEAAVAEQIAAAAAADASPPPPTRTPPPPPPASRGEEVERNLRDPNRPESRYDRSDRNGRYPDEAGYDRPRRWTGKSLYGYAKDAGRLSEVMAYGAGEDFPERILDWNGEQATAAAAIFDTPAPARNGQRRRTPSRN